MGEGVRAIGLDPRLLSRPSCSENDILEATARQRLFSFRKAHRSKEDGGTYQNTSYLNPGFGRLNAGFIIEFTGVEETLATPRS